MEQNTSSQSCDAHPSEPSKEELNAELLAVPEPPEQPSPIEPPGIEQVLTSALSHIRGKRGGDLVAVILVGSGARRALTSHSDLDLIALVKGQDEGQEIIRIADRLVDIRYRSHEAVEEELSFAPRLPPLLRKGRVLFEYEGVGTKVLEKAQQLFRHGPPPVGLNERIRLKAACLHWLGKAEDLVDHPANAEYLLGIFLEELLAVFFRLRGFWLTSPADMLRFVSSRDPAMGDLVSRFLTVTTLSERLELGRQLADLLFKDIPNPPRVD